MLPKSKRVEKPLFSKVFKNSRVFSAPHMSLRVSPGIGPSPKFSFVVGKTTAKLAVDRNLLRRRGYSFIRETVKESVKPIVCIFTLKKGSPELNYTEFSSEILSLLKEAGVL